jgi:poly-beta-hydroxybutyrate-responsive repressor
LATDHREIDARPKNWLTPWALVVLWEGSSHGYALMGWLEELGIFEYDASPGASGTLYRTLKRMEDGGLCESEWRAPGDGPARRTYSITEAGEEQLAAWAESCRRYRGMVDSFHRAYTSKPRRNRPFNDGANRSRSNRSKKADSRFPARARY